MPDQEPRGGRAAIAAFRFRDFRIWWFGFVFASVATVTQTFGLGWLAVEQAQRDGGEGRAALYLGLVGLARAIPAIALGLFAGVAVDRYDRRKVLVLSELGAALATLVMALVALGERSSLGWILLAAAAISATRSLYIPARQAIQPRLVGEANMMSAFGFNTAALNASALLGPLIGGIVVVAAGAGALLLISAVVLFGVAASLALLSAQPTEGAVRGVRAAAAVREGLVYIRRSPTVLWLLVVFLGAVILVRPYAELMPTFVTDVLRLGPLELSWLLAASGVGFLLSGFATAGLAGVERRGVIVIVGAIVAGSALALLSLQRELGPSLPLILLTGFSLMLASGAIGVLIQITTPDHLRGRVIALQSLLIEGGVPGGTLLLGALGSLIGIDWALRLGGLGLAAVGIVIAIAMPSLLRARLSLRPLASTEPA